MARSLKKGPFVDDHRRCIGWCVATNPYLSRVTRIQDDRAQRVIDSGPYAYVRHPMYIGNILLMFCIALPSARVTR